MTIPSSIPGISSLRKFGTGPCPRVIRRPFVMETAAFSLEDGEARTVTVSQVFDTSPEDLWDACTNPERISRWFLPGSVDEFDDTVGRYAAIGVTDLVVHWPRADDPYAADLLTFERIFAP
jgi:hypothetical protein